jgi:hypothetical protein
VIVDGMIGFLGGIDICLGRYEHETPRYLLYEPVEMKKVMDLKSADDEMPMVDKVEISPDFTLALQGQDNDWILKAQNTDDGSNRKWHGKDQVPTRFVSDPNIDDRGIWYGKDYHNGMCAEYKDVRNWEETMPENKRDQVPRMPRRDISLVVQGTVVEDMTRHFIQYWNFGRSCPIIRFLNSIAKSSKILLPPGYFS